MYAVVMMCSTTLLESIETFVIMSKLHYTSITPVNDSHLSHMNLVRHVCSHEDVYHHFVIII
jgi:hypothetical protein